MKPLAVLALLALPFVAVAHDCDPPATACIGTAPRTVSTPAGESTVRWLQVTYPSTPPGMVSWRMYRPVDLVECRWTTSAILAAAGRVAVTPTYAQFKAEITAAQDACVATPGSQREYEFLRLRWLGCETLRINPPPNTPTGWLPADWCGPAPVPPVITPPVQPAWATAGTTTYTRNGSSLTGATVNGVARGVACNCTSPLRIGTVTYCTFAGAPSASTVASCRQP